MRPTIGGVAHGNEVEKKADLLVNETGDPPDLAYYVKYPFVLVRLNSYRNLVVHLVELIMQS